MGRVWSPLAFVLATALGCSAPPSEDESTAPAVKSVDPGSESQRTIDDQQEAPIESRVPPPGGFERVPAGGGSFGAWLRQLAVRAGRPPVYLFDGRKKANQYAHHAVLDVDVGDTDLQQCADAVIRLRAEYLFSGPCRASIAFNFTSGDAARWAEWRDGFRPVVRGNSVSWKRSAEADSSYPNFRDYLDIVFMYAGSASLERELTAVANFARPEIGDVFIQGGFPGHAVIVVDVAVNDAGERAFLLAQSYMPAQDMHILNSYEDISPWYGARATGVLTTPEWTFNREDLRRFPAADCGRP